MKHEIYVWFLILVVAAFFTVIPAMVSYADTFVVLAGLVLSAALIRASIHVTIILLRGYFGVDEE